MPAKRKTWIELLQPGIGLLGAVLTMFNTGRILWEAVFKPAYCSPPFVHYGWVGLGLFLVSVVLWLVLPSIRGQRERCLVKVGIGVSLLAILAGLIVAFGVPWWQQRRIRGTYPFYIQVAQFQELGVDAQLSLKLQDLLNQELHQSRFDLCTAAVGKRCQVFGSGDHEKAERARARADAAILLYGWIDSEGGECHLTVDRAWLPPLPVDTTRLFEQLGVEPPERVDPALAFIVPYRDVHQTECDTKVKSHVIGDVKECCALFGSGLAYHMEQDRLGGATLFDFDRQQRAIELFQEALDRPCPNTRLILLFQGSAYAALGQPDDAEEAWKKVVDGGSENVQARINLAALALARGDSTGALAWLKPVASQLAPDNIAVQYLLASVYAMNDQYIESLAVWRSIEPDDPIARRNADFMQDLVNLDRTQSHEWIAKNILQALAYRNLGIGLISVDRPEQAEVALEMALSLPYIGVESYTAKELQQDLHYWLGIAYSEQGRRDEWQRQWELIGPFPYDILFSPDQRWVYWEDLLGPEFYLDLQRELGPQIEMLP